MIGFALYKNVNQEVYSVLEKFLNIPTPMCAATCDFGVICAILVDTFGKMSQNCYTELKYLSKKDNHHNQPQSPQSSGNELTCHSSH